MATNIVNIIQHQQKAGNHKHKPNFNLEAQVNANRKRQFMHSVITKKHNFSAGPCILPQEVFEQAAKAVLEYDRTGLSILETSHRSNEFLSILTHAQDLVLELLDLKDKGYQALFLHGGASLQFLMVPYNLMGLHGKAGYLQTGTWANAAIDQAKTIGETIIIESSKDKNYSYIPKNFAIPKTLDYFHCTSNNTIYGTQMNVFPKGDTLLVCDMSSDLFSRTLDFSQFDLIYAGAQKNIGPAGVSVVVIKESILSNTKHNIPSMLDYRQHIIKNNLYNTPPVFAIYTSLLNLQWLKKQGGIKAIEKLNNIKAKRLYAEIDRNSLFKGTAAVEDRSIMNATFVIEKQEYAVLFEQLCEQAGIYGIKGHRSVGGYRASMYNALTLDSVQVLIQTMKDLETRVIK